MHFKRLILLTGALLFGVLGLVLVTGASAAPAGDATRGQYIFAAAGGCGCHGANLAGFKASGPPFGETFNGPFGSVPAPNITPDKATGVGNWTDDQLINAIRNGVDNEGHQLFPIMPYNTYHFMSDQDVADLVAFLRTVPSVTNNVPERKLNVPVPPVPPLPPSPATAPTSGVDRGRYLVSAISDCGSCHTPTTAEGAPDMSKLLAGSFIAAVVDGRFQVGPNITPDQATGIGDWTQQQIVTYLKQGIGPNGRTADNLMGEVIFGLFQGLGFNKLTDDDAAAIAAFLKSIPAVSNVPIAPPVPSGPPAGAPPAPPAAGAVGGTGPADAVALTGNVSGTLSDQHQWFKFGFGGGSIQGVIMNFPGNLENPANENVVGFNVFTGGCDSTGACTLTKVGEGTVSNLPFGTKYWNTKNAGSFFIETFNNSGSPVGFGLGLTGSTFPPSPVPFQ